MRLQLRYAALVAVLLAGATRAYAQDHVEAKTTIFLEPGEGIEELRVFTPQIEAGIGLGQALDLSLGYDADVVSGATPKVYSVDAVSSASKFSDLRNSGHVGFGYQAGDSKLTGSYTYGQEHDYKSHAVNLGMTTDLRGKNTTLAIAYGHNFDSVCDADNADKMPLERRALSDSAGCFKSDPNDPTVTRSIAIDHYQATLTQVLSPVSLIQLGFDASTLRGFQSSPYRRVRVYEIEAQEALPDSRERLASFIRLNYALPAVASAVNFMARFYVDSWRVRSGTVDLEYHQYMGKKLLLSLRGRAYQQTGAVFFRDAEDYARGGPVGKYWTGDRELSPFRDLLVGAKLSFLSIPEGTQKAWGVFDDVEITAKGDIMFYDALTPHPPNPHRFNSLIDAIILQGGIRLRW